MTNTLWKQRLSNYSCGALTLTLGTALGSAPLALYRLIDAHHPSHLPTTPLTFALTFLAIDALYYLQHRAEHRHRWLWKVHAVHHQARICDASVSLRTSFLAPLTVLTFHLVLALAGVPFAVYFPLYLAHTAAVFLLHTRLPSWLNRAGWVFNSPYLHRAHHSSDARLRGKNFGGVFIVWDRLFGTFEPDCDGATEFGLGQQPTPLNPVRANLAPFAA